VTTTPDAPGEVSERGLSRELRLVVAASGALVALLLAVLHVVAARTDLLMLDLREWRPVSSVPGLTGEELARFYEGLQVVPPEQRPFRLSLQLPPTARPGDVLAAERVVDAGEGSRCLFVLSFVSAPAPGSAATTLPVLSQVVAGDRVVSLPAITPAAAGSVWYLRDVQSRAGKLPIRFEVRASGVAPGMTARPPAAIHFELARLRPCSD
jgi:hypothetical protein